MEAQAALVDRMPQTDKLEGLIDAALNNAVNKLWMAHNWQFRRVETTLATPTSTEYVELPKNFGTFGYLEFADGSVEGHPITFRNEDPFRKMYPNLTAQGGVRPQHVMIARDADESKWRAVFGPRSSSSWTLDFVYYLAPGAITKFPTGLEELLMSVAWYCLWPAGTSRKAVARLIVTEELNDAITIDQVFHNRVESVKRENAHGFTESDAEPFNIFDYD